MAKRFFWILPIFWIFQGCALTSYTIGGIKPSARPMESMEYKTKKPVELKASSFDLFWVWTVTPPADMNRAFDASMAEHEADNFIQVSWVVEKQFWLVGNVHILRVNAIPIQYLEEESPSAGLQ